MTQRPWTRERRATTIRLQPPDWDKLGKLSELLRLPQNEIFAQAIRMLFDAVTMTKQHDQQQAGK